MDYMTTDEVAALLRTPPSTVRYWRFQGRGPHAVKVGRRLLYTRADVDAWLQTLSREAAAS